MTFHVLIVNVLSNAFVRQVIVYETCTKPAWCILMIQQTRTNWFLPYRTWLYDPYYDKIGLPNTTPIKLIIRNILSYGSVDATNFHKAWQSPFCRGKETHPIALVNWFGLHAHELCSNPGKVGDTPCDVDPIHNMCHPLIVYPYETT